MATISTLAYKIVADTQNFLNGVKLSRTEMQAAKKVFKDSIDPVTAYKAELDALAGLHAKGALTAEQYSAAVARTAQASDPAIIAQREAEAIATEAAVIAARERDVVLQRGLALSQSLATPEEQRAMRLKEAKDLLDQNAISQEDFNRAIQRMDVERYQQAHDKLKGLGDSLTNTGMRIAAVGAGITAVFGGTAYAATSAAAEYEQTTIAFSTLMGSAEKAKSTLADLTEFAASTPFQMPQLQTVARGLLGFGIEGEALIEQVRMMGDAAAATNTDIAELGQIFVKVRGSGRLMGDTFKQLSERGILFHKDIAEHFGIAESEVAKFISAGKVGFPEVEAMMRKLTSEGGRYSGAMVDLSESALGLSSTLSDNVSIALRGIGEELLPMQKAMTSWAISMVSGLTQLDGGTRKTVAYTVALGVAMGGVVTASGLVMVATGKVVTWYAAATLAASKYAAAKWALTAAAGAAKLAIAGMGVALAALPGIIVYQLMPSIREYNAALKESKRLSDELGKRDTGRRQEVISVAMEMPETGRLEYLQAELEQAKLNTDGLFAASERAKNQAEELAPSFVSAWQSGRKVWQVQIAEYEEMRKRYGESNEFVKALEKEIAKLAGTRIEQPAIDQAKVAAEVEKTTAKLREQIATVGYSAEQVERWKLAQEGANEAQLQQVALLQREAAARREAVSLRDDTNELVDALQRQIETAGMSADAIQLMDLRARGLSESWVTLIEKMQQGAAATREAANTQADLDSLVKSLEEQIATAGMSADEMERYRFAQRGVGTEALAVVEALQQQSAAAIEVAESQKRARDEALAAQQALQSNLDQTTDRLREQIKTYGMSADEAELWRLKDKGATDDQIAAIKLMQDELAALQGQKDAMRSSETTIGAGSLADAYDAIQRAQEATATQTVTPPVVEVPDIAVATPIAPPLPDVVTVETDMSSTWADFFARDEALTTRSGMQAEEPESQEVPILNRIAAGIDALVRKEGIVIEEVSV